MPVVWCCAETCGYPVDKSLLDRKTYITSVLHCSAPAASFHHFDTALHGACGGEKKKRKRKILNENDYHYENDYHLHLAENKKGGFSPPLILSILIIPFPSVASNSPHI